MASLHQQEAGQVTTFVLLTDMTARRFAVQGEDEFFLPRFQITPKFYPEIDELSGKLRVVCGRDVQVLRCLEEGNAPEGRPRLYSAVWTSDPRNIFKRHTWTRAENVGTLSYMSDDLKELCRQELVQIAQDVRGGSLAPWDHPSDWHREAYTWIDKCLTERTNMRNPRIRQIRTWSISAVYRIESEEGRLYFKAAPGMFPAEVPVTVDVARRFPAYSARIVDSDLDRGWLLSEDIGDVMLRNQNDGQPWRAAIDALAEVQIWYAENQKILDALPLERREPGRILPTLSEFIKNSEKMGTIYRQDRTRDALGRLESGFDKVSLLVDQLKSVELPSTLDHGDLDGYNIFVRDGTPVLMDWSDSSISHPFYTAVMIRQVGRSPELTETFLEKWSDYGTSRDLMRAWDAAKVLAPLERAFHYHENIVPHIPRPSVDLRSLRSFVPHLLKLAADELDGVR